MAAIPLVMQSRDHLQQPSGQTGRHLSLWFAVICCCCNMCHGVCLINDNVKKYLYLLLLCRIAQQLTVPVDRRMDIRCTSLFFVSDN